MQATGGACEACVEVSGHYPGKGCHPDQARVGHPTVLPDTKSETDTSQGLRPSRIPASQLSPKSDNSSERPWKNFSRPLGITLSLA